MRGNSYVCSREVLNIWIIAEVQYENKVYR